MSQSIEKIVPLWQAMLMFLLPLVMGNVLQSFSTTMGAIYYGQMLGVSALAAAAAFLPVVFFLLSFLIGLSNAAAVLIGQAFGAHDQVSINKVAGASLMVCAISGAVIALVCGVFTRSLLEAMGTPPEILADALTYARVMFIFAPLLFIFIAYTTILRGVGDTRSPFNALLICTVINLVLTPALIQGWGGLPQLGMTSAPYAAVVSYILSLVWLCVHLRQVDSPLALNYALFSALKIDLPILKQLLRLGIPSGIQIVSVSLSEIAVIAFVNAFGSGATAAYGAVNQIVGYVQFPAISIGIAASIFTAQSIGGARVQRLRHIARTAMCLNLAIGGSLIFIVYLFSSQIVGWFVNVPGTAATAQRLIEISLWSYLVFGLSQVLQGIMRGSGTVLWPTAISICAIWALEVPVAYFLSRRIGLDGVWMAYPIAFAGGFVLQAAYYLMIWRKHGHARLI